MRFDAVPNDAESAGAAQVVTLSDITAARRIERERVGGAGRRARDLAHAAAEPAAGAAARATRASALDAWHLAAEQELIVGGDWYDVIETRGGLWLVMGDVAGHGVAAAAQAGQLRHSLRVYAHEGFGLAESVSRLNELVTQTELTDMATMCIVAIDARARRGAHRSAPGIRRRCCSRPTGRPRLVEVRHRRRARRDRRRLRGADVRRSRPGTGSCSTPTG